jgi:hypothetical protein
VRIARHGERGHECFGLLDDGGRVRDAAGLMTDVDPNDLAATLDRLSRAEPNDLPRVARGTRLGCLVARVGKIICIGLNYADHAAESGMKVPEEPVIFMKATSAINGPNDDVVLPHGSEKSDWEVELGVIIGTRASYIFRKRSNKSYRSLQPARHPVSAWAKSPAGLPQSRGCSDLGISKLGQQRQQVVAWSSTRGLHPR